MTDNGSELQIPGLRDTELIGHGGSGLVYRAVDTSNGRAVAVKILRSSVDAASARRFRRERRIMRKLSAIEGVAEICAAGELPDGSPYLVMPFYEGGSLHELVESQGPLAWPDAVAMIEQVARTVSIAHESGVYHRDLKPANILLTDDGETRVIDFGTGYLHGTAMEITTTSRPMLTLAYAPPEAFADEEIDYALADVYSLAATLWALLAGHRPFKPAGEEHSALALIGRVANEPAGELPAEIPWALRRLVRESMAKDPALRPQSMVEFTSRLQAVRDRTSTVIRGKLGGTTDEAFLEQGAAPASARSDTPRRELVAAGAAASFGGFTVASSHGGRLGTIDDAGGGESDGAATGRGEGPVVRLAAAERGGYRSGGDGRIDLPIPGGGRDASDRAWVVPAVAVAMVLVILLILVAMVVELSLSRGDDGVAADRDVRSTVDRSAAVGPLTPIGDGSLGGVDSIPSSATADDREPVGADVAARPTTSGSVAGPSTVTSTSGPQPVLSSTSSPAVPGPPEPPLPVPPSTGTSIAASTTERPATTPSTTPTTIPTTTRPATTAPTTTTTSKPPAPAPERFVFDDQTSVEDDKDVKIKVLDNDDPGTSSFDEDTLRIVRAPSHAEKYRVHGDHLHYRSVEDYAGIDVIEYDVCTLDRRCGRATVTITVVSD